MLFYAVRLPPSLSLSLSLVLSIVSAVIFLDSLECNQTIYNQSRKPSPSL